MEAKLKAAERHILCQIRQLQMALRAIEALRAKRYGEAMILKDQMAFQTVLARRKSYTVTKPVAIVKPFNR